MGLTNPAAREQPTPRMTDAELIATAALANVEAVLMAGDNAERALEGHLPMWRTGTGMMEHGARLDLELYQRRNAPLDVPTAVANGDCR